MRYTLYDDFIPLQALLKEIGILQSGGAAKAFLAENRVLFNDELENRRGKKLRLGDTITLPDKGMTITLIAPTAEQIKEHEANKAEKARVAALVKELNQANKKQNKAKPKANQAKKHLAKSAKATQNKGRQAVRFPGT